MPWSVIGRIALRAANRAYVRRQIISDLQVPRPVTAPSQADLARVHQAAAIAAEVNAELASTVCVECGRSNNIVRRDEFAQGAHRWYLKFSFDEAGAKVYRCPDGRHMVDGDETSPT